MPVLRHACGMGVGPCTMAEPRHCGTKTLRLRIRVLGPVEDLCQLKNLWQRSFLVTENRELARATGTQARAVMVTRVRVKLAFLT